MELPLYTPELDGTISWPLNSANRLSDRAKTRQASRNDNDAKLPIDGCLPLSQKQALSSCTSNAQQDRGSPRSDGPSFCPRLCRRPYHDLDSGPGHHQYRRIQEQQRARPISEWLDALNAIFDGCSVCNPCPVLSCHSKANTLKQRAKSTAKGRHPAGHEEVGSRLRPGRHVLTVDNMLPGCKR